MFDISYTLRLDGYTKRLTVIHLLACYMTFVYHAFSIINYYADVRFPYLTQIKKPLC